MRAAIKPYSPRLPAKTWMRTVPTKSASPLLVGWPPASPVKPIFFHEAAMADWAPTARVPESAAMPMERPEAREERPQQRPAARWAKPLYWLYPAKPVPLSGFTILPFRITVTLGIALIEARVGVAWQKVRGRVVEHIVYMSTYSTDKNARHRTKRDPGNTLDITHIKP